MRNVTKGISSFSFLLLNSRSLINKISQLRSLITLEYPSIVFITETWLSSCIPDDDIFVDHYNCFRGDRTSGLGGGTLIYIHECFSATQIAVKQCSSLGDSVWCILNLSENQNILCGCVYRPPGFNSGTDIALSEHFNEVSEIPVAYRVIAGDFNLPEICWDPPTFPPKLTLFSEAFISGNWVQQITIPTRKCNTLDLLFTANVEYCSVDTLNLCSFSDHEIIRGILTLNAETNQLSKYKYFHRVYHTCTKENVISMIRSFDWSNFFSSNDLKYSFDSFYKYLTDCLDILAPLSTKFTNNKAPGHLSIAARRKLRQLRKALICTHDYYALARMNEILINEENHRLNRIRNLELSIVKKNCNGKDLSKLFKSRLSYSRQQIRLMFDPVKKAFIENRIDICNLFADHYSSNFSSNILNCPTSGQLYNAVLSNITFSVSDISKLISCFRHSYSSGPDGLSSNILKMALPDIAPMMAKLFSLSMEFSEYPHVWKSTYIRPHFKSGSKLNVDNFRPINVTSILSRIMEKIIKNQMLSFLTLQNVINNYQYGFLSKRSCSTCLTDFFDLLTSYKDNNISAAILYFDFSKAFDTVPHEGLIYKLRMFGIINPLYKWLQSFLENRTLVVTLNNSLSTPRPIKSGVIQGSVLGPLLFLLYVNDISKEIHHGKSFLYADDLKIVYNLSDRSPSDITNDIQRDLARIDNWCTTWGMRLNTSKCGIMYVGKNCLTNPLILNGVNLDIIYSVNDLGVLYTNTLSFSPHIASITSKAIRTSEFISRNFFMNKIKVLLFKTLVVPRLQYCSFIYSSANRSDIVKTERVQRRFTKRITSLHSDAGYLTRCKDLNLDPIWLVRLKLNLLFIFKLLNGYCHTNSNVRLKSASQYVLRNSAGRICIDRVKSRSRANFFLQRYSRIWNQLPERLRLLKSPSSFKSELNYFMNISNCMSLLRTDGIDFDPRIGPGNI